MFVMGCLFSVPLLYAQYEDENELSVPNEDYEDDTQLYDSDEFDEFENEEDYADDQMVEEAVGEAPVPEVALPLPATADTGVSVAPAVAEKPTKGTVQRAQVISGPVKEADISRLVEKNTIVFNFKNAKIKTLLDWVEKIYGVTFVPDDAVKGGSKQPGFNLDDPNFKISFKTEKLLSKTEAWSLFTTFLDLAGLTIVPMPEKGFYRVTLSANAKTLALDVFMGIDATDLPDDDVRIRYIYFLQNTTVDQVKPFLETLKLTAVDYFNELKAVIFTDKASKIRSVMKIVYELDKATLPETIKVIRLVKADVDDVVTLYEKVAKQESPGALPMYGAKKEPTLFYFPSDVRLFGEKRTNALIILGPHEGVGRVEQFVREYIDKDVDSRESPLHKIKLNYTNAKQMADILSAVTDFDAASPAAKYGGIRAGEKYFRKMIFVPEESTNQLLINASAEDFLYIKKIIEQLDTKQRQVAIEVMIVSVDMNDAKQLGTQIRNKGNDLLGTHVAFQTSGIQRPGGHSSVLVDPTTNSLMANLIQLAQGQTAGTTMLSFGTGTNIWGILKMLQTITKTNVLSNPFLIATNKYQASVATGETRRVTTAQVLSPGADPKDTKGDLDAELRVTVTPSIPSDPDVANIINLQIDISIAEFLSSAGTDPQDPRSSKQIITTANIMNKEVLALGGLIRELDEETEFSVPILGRIPLLGWLFKFKSRAKRKENLLIFISPRVIEAGSAESRDYTANKEQDAYAFAESTVRYKGDKREPIHRWFFGDHKKPVTVGHIEDFMQVGKQFEAVAEKEEREREQLLAQKHAKIEKAAQHPNEKQSHMLVRRQQGLGDYFPDAEGQTVKDAA